MMLQMVVGTSEPQDARLTDDGVALDGTSWDITIEFREHLDELSEVQVEWLDQDAGTVRLTGTENVPVGHYHFRFKITDGSGDDAYVPSGDKPAAVFAVVRV